jgi:hypothetical protein
LSAPDKTSRFRSLSLVFLSELYRFKIHRATLPFIDLKLKSHCTVPLYRRPHAVLILNFRYCVAGGALAVGPLSLRGLRLGHLSNHSEHQDGLSTHYHQPYHTITAQNTKESRRPILTEALSVLDALQLGCTLIKCTRLESTPHRKYSATEALPSLSLGCTPSRIHFDEMHSARMHSSASDALGLEFTPPWKNSASGALHNRYISSRMHSTSCTTRPSNSMISYCAHSQLT